THPSAAHSGGCADQCLVHIQPIWPLEGILPAYRSHFPTQTSCLFWTAVRASESWERNWQDRTIRSGGMFLLVIPTGIIFRAFPSFAPFFRTRITSRFTCRVRSWEAAGIF